MTNKENSNPKHKFNLEERTLRFSKDNIILCKKLPSSTINREIISQLIRASSSVGANYREANDSLSKKDFAHRIKITRKEAKESHYWLELLKTANPNLDGEVDVLLQEALELKKIFSAIAMKCV